MAYIYSFCFKFSLRLGSLIVGILSLFQGIFMIICSSLAISYPNEISKQLNTWKEENNLVFMAPVFTLISRDPNTIFLVSLILSSLYTLFCCMLIYGSFSITTYLMYPYIFFEFLRLGSLLATHVVGMMLIKENIINLGLLIGLCVFGGFLLLGLYYLWFCTLNLVLVIRELLKEIAITDITNFPKKPAELTNVYTIKKPKYYNY